MWICIFDKESQYVLLVLPSTSYNLKRYWFSVLTEITVDWTLDPDVLGLAPAKGAWWPPSSLRHKGRKTAILLPWPFSNFF